MARVLKESRSFTCTRRVHPLTEWTIPAFAFPAEAGTHLPTPEGWKAELVYCQMSFCSFGLLCSNAISKPHKTHNSILTNHTNTDTTLQQLLQLQRACCCSNLQLFPGSETPDRNGQWPHRLLLAADSYQLTLQCPGTRDDVANNVLELVQFVVAHGTGGGYSRVNFITHWTTANHRNWGSLTHNIKF